MTDAVLAYPIGDRLYLNITDRCTLRCRFCPKHNGSLVVRGHDLSLAHRPEPGDILAAIGDPAPYAEVVFCGYGEPTLRLEPLLEVAAWLKARGARVRVNTDGLANRVHKRNVLPEMTGLVDALSVSLNAQDEATYVRHCDPALPDAFAAVKEFLRLAPRYVPRVTATALDGLPGVDIAACQRLAEHLGVAFRRRELGVVG
ncbi:MAG: TatD family nuclease-associated radical SAM protein [Gammaproteobacteria bacterium]|jgi:TatD family-associated radical SAM protein